MLLALFLLAVQKVQTLTVSLAGLEIAGWSATPTQAMTLDWTSLEIPRPSITSGAVSAILLSEIEVLDVIVPSKMSFL